MPLDRATTLRQAEKLLRQGKLDQAIDEYRRLVDDQPRDWNTANMLGDLLVRAGQLDRAIEQFSRMADSLYSAGFVPRAAAIYKKILKLKPDDDNALMRAGSMAAQQGLLADARAFYGAAVAARRRRGDERGALEVTARLGALDKRDIAARLAGADASLALGDEAAARQAFAALAMMLVGEGRDDEALAPLRRAAALDPANADLAKHLVRILSARGLTAEAAPYVTADSAGNDPALMLLAAEAQLHAGDGAAGLGMVDRVLEGNPAAAPAVCRMAFALASTDRERAFAVLDRVVAASIAREDWDSAASMLSEFVMRAPHFVPAQIGRAHV